MFDVGSYHSAINVLEGNSRLAPRPAPRAAPRSRQRPPPTYDSATRHERVSRSYGDQDYDGDWLSVPVNGETRSHSRTTRGRHSEDLDGGWTTVDQRSTSQPRSKHHAYSYQTREEYGDDGILPLSNGVKSMTLGSRQPQQRRYKNVETSRTNGSSTRRVDSHADRRHRSAVNLNYEDEIQHQPRGRTSYSRVTNGNSFVPNQEWEEADQRPSMRLIYNGKQDPKMHRRSVGVASRAAPEERQFLSEVQKELEFQRQNWKGEIEKMTGSILSGESSSMVAKKSSYVDTSGLEPRFKAFVDIGEFPPSSVTVNVDKISNKIIVEAKQTGAAGSVAKTFTQKVQMPRFADDTRLTARMNRDGILKVEVPLIYYFPQEERNDDKAKSFVYEVRENPDGTKTMEILVKPSRDLSIEDIRVGLENDKLIVYAERINGSGRSQRQTIKKYTLPENADIDGISSNPTRDGCLTILVPILDKFYR